MADEPTPTPDPDSVQVLLRKKYLVFNAGEKPWLSREQAEYCRREGLGDVIQQEPVSPPQRTAPSGK